LAAAQGNVFAQYNLALKYENGQGVVQDYAEAVRLYKLAAAQGNAEAQTNLGAMYTSGQGVVQDYIRAHMWFNLGAVKGYSTAVKNRDIVAKWMTSQQIAEAQKMARECQARDFKNCD
jgi:TPR repeat protein